MPRKAAAVTVAASEAIITTPKLRVVIDRSTTSSAKKTPAIGALNAAATPPATPQATSRRMLSFESRNACATVEPMPAPICTIGPCLPAAPPEPMVSAVVSAIVGATRARMRLPAVSMASITSETPWPRVSRAKRVTIGPINRPPSAGRIMIRQPGSSPINRSLIRSKKNQSARASSSWNPTAASPVSTPTIAASTIGPMRS